MTSQSTLRCAVVGNPIAHSRSPDIHHAFAQQHGLDLLYEKIKAEPTDFAEQVTQFFNQGGKGLNITVPFKETAFAMAQQLSTRAQLAGAVNTLWVENQVLHGCNTDGMGLVSDLVRLGFAPKEQRILLIGAGGAAKGVILPLLEAGAKQIHIINRTAAKAHELKEQILSSVPNYAKQLSAGELSQTTGEWDIVINATSAGLHQQSPLQQALHFSQKSLAYDMVYGAQPTAFMESCAHQGATQCADGLGMLVGQAAQSFYIWHQLVVDPEPVLQQLRLQLSS